MIRCFFFEKIILAKENLQKLVQNQKDTTQKAK